MATSETTNRTIPEYEVSQEHEKQLMIRFTKEFTREHVFAVDLMVHTMETYNLEFENYIFPNDVGRSAPSDLDSGIKKFIGLVVPIVTKNTTDSLRDMTIDLENASYEEFKCYANAMSSRYEPRNELKVSAYLDICMVLASKCCVAYMNGVTRAPYFGIMLMCRKFAHYFIQREVPLDPWQEMKKSAKYYADRLERELRGEESSE